MKSRKLRTLQVSELGFGCMNLASNYGRAVPIDDAIKVIREAHSKGVTFFDTAEVDGPAADQSSAVPKCDFIVGEVVCVVGWHPKPKS